VDLIDQRKDLGSRQSEYLLDPLGPQAINNGGSSSLFFHGKNTPSIIVE
jgi:hypothetical protein